MIEFLLVAGQWLGLAVLLYGACLLIACAAEDIRSGPRSSGPVNEHDWDAQDRVLENRQRLDS